jgi:hypothetical protein
MRRFLAALLFVFAALPAYAAGNDWPALEFHFAYDPDALAYFSALSSNGCAAPSGQFKNAFNNYVIGEKSNGFWGTQAMGYLFTTTDSCTAAVNIYQPVLYKVTWNGSPTFTVATGLKGDSATIDGDTNINENAIPLLAQNNSHIAIWSAANQTNLLGQSAGTIVQFYSNGGSNNLNTRCTTSTTVTDTGGGTAGLGYCDRTDSAHVTTGKNGIVLSNNVASTSVAPQAQHMLICRSAAVFCASTANILFVEVGSAISNEQLHYNDVNTMLAAIQTGAPPNPDQCNGVGSDPCLPAYFTGSGGGTNQATVVAGTLAVSAHAPLPKDNTIDQTTFKFFPATMFEGSNPRSNANSTYLNGGGVGYFSWAYRSNGVDATRVVTPNPVTPIQYYTTGGKNYQCLVPMSSIAKADAATQARIAWAIGYPAHDVSGFGYLDLTEAQGIADAHVLFYDSVDGTPNLADQIQTLCTDITTYPGYAALPNDYVVLPYGQLSTLSTTPKDVMVDWEVQEGHTCAQTTAQMTKLASIVHSKSMNFVVYTNPLDAGTSPYNGWCLNGAAGANLDTVQALVDYFGIMLLDGNKIGTVQQELAYAVAGFSSINYAKTMLIPLINKITVSDATYLRSQIVANSIGRVDIFLNGAIPGGQCSRPTNEKIGTLIGIATC